MTKDDKRRGGAAEDDVIFFRTKIRRILKKYTLHHTLTCGCGFRCGGAVPRGAVLGAGAGACAV